MENQNANPQPGNSQNPPQGNPGPQNGPQNPGSSPLPPEFVGLPPAQETQSAEERLVVAERYIAELLRGYQMAGQAINRLETHLFSLFKVCFDKELMNWDSFMEAQKGLMKNEDLLAFWEVKDEADAYSRAHEAEQQAQQEKDVKENSDSSSE